MAETAQGVQKVVVSDDSLIKEVQRAIVSQNTVCIEGEQLIPSKLEGSMYRFKLEAKTLEGPALHD